MFTRLSRASWFTIFVLILLTAASIYGDILTEQTIRRVRNGGVYTTATVVGSINFNFRPMTSIVEYTIDGGETVSAKLITGQLADQQTVIVVYDPEDPTLVSLAIGGRQHTHLILAFALAVVCFFVFFLGVENFPDRHF